MTQEKRSNLGRGLAALLGDDVEEFGALDREKDVHSVPIEHLHPNAYQPRQDFDEESIRALADSIRQNGMLQPILVRRHADRSGEFEIVAGERRWRAAQLAQLHEIPVTLRDLTDSQALELAIVENVQRQDLTALEEAEGYRRLIEEFKHTQDDLARIIGKSRSHIANTLRLLNLPTPIKALIAQNELTPGHARALIGAENPEVLAHHVVKKGLTVRQTERLARSEKPAEKKRRPPSAPVQEKDADTLALERDLSALLGLKVTIKFSGDGGALVIEYQSLEQLDDVLNRLTQLPVAATA